MRNQNNFNFLHYIGLIFILQFFFFIDTGFAKSPELDWVLKAGGVNIDEGQSVATDLEGNVYVAGNFQETANFDGQVLTATNENDLFLSKYNGQGKLIWVQAINGEKSESVCDIVMDSDGKLLLFGSYDGNINFGHQSSQPVEQPNLFITRFAPSGEIEWVKILGDSTKEEAGGIAASDSGSFTILGSFIDTTKIGSYKLTGNGSSDIFLAKFNQNGNVTWVKTFGGSQNDLGLKIAIDNDGNHFIAGLYEDTINFDTIRLTSSGGTDIFLAKLSPQGDVVWAKSIGSVDDDDVTALTPDDNGDIFISGNFTNRISISTKRLSSSGKHDVFLAKFRNNGVVDWASQGKSINDIYSTDMALAPNNSITLIGKFQAQSYFEGTSIVPDGKYDIFYVQYDTDGSISWLESAGGSEEETGASIAYNHTGLAFITGSFQGTTQFESTNLVATDSSDIFLAKFKETKLVKSIELVTPDDGEVWFTSKSNLVEWTADSYSGEIMINLSKDNGAIWNFAQITPNDGSTQIIPQNSDTSGRAKIRLLYVANNEIQAESVSYFTLINPASVKKYVAAKLPRTYSAPVIDGILDEPAWNVAHPAQSLDAGGDVAQFLTTWDDTTDSRITWRAIWSEANNQVYLAIEVKDDSAGIPDHDPEHYHQDDAIELFVDGNHDGGFYSAYQTAQHWLIRNDNQIHLGNALGVATDAWLQSAVQQGEQGNWTLEVALNIYDLLPDTPRLLAEGDTIGFDIWYNDSDNKDAPWGLYLREHQIGWGFLGKAWNNADAFQDLILGPESIEVAPYIKAQNSWGLSSDYTSIDIIVEETPQPLTSFGFKLKFDNEQFEFKSLNRGLLTAHFSQFEFAGNSSGEILITASDTLPIPVSSSGTIATIVLAVKECNPDQQSTLQIVDLENDITEFNAYNGVFTCSQPCLRGDVNLDGTITSTDALCAFKYFLVQPMECDNECVQYSSDVNCDGEVTSGDALTIFRAFLDNIQPPLDCMPGFAKNLHAPNLYFAATPFFSKDEITLPLEINNITTLASFGFNLTYPSELLSFERINASELTQNWQMLDANEIAPGVIKIGGFSLESIEESGSLISVSFRIKESAKGEAKFKIHQLKDDLANGETFTTSFKINNTGIEKEIPKTYELFPNYPNPFNMATEIKFQLPETSDITLSIFNTLGQEIKTLLAEKHPAGVYTVNWDGRNQNGEFVSSGIYFYRLKTNNFIAIRKMVIIK